jgi:hypothetical protein
MFQSGVVERVAGDLKDIDLQKAYTVLYSIHTDRRQNNAAKVGLRYCTTE